MLGKALKFSRKSNRIPNKIVLKETHHQTEQKLLHEATPYVQSGFILAKAVRIASISQPDYIESFSLRESIKADDLLSSFILNT